MSKPLWRWFALLLPLLVLLGGIVRGERLHRDGEEWRFDVAGYDPRDLLRGQYLRFRIVEEWGDPHEGATEQSSCLCLERTRPRDSASLRAASCDFARASCSAYLVREELQGLNRFYVPETRARELEQRLGEALQPDGTQAQVLVVIDDAGRAAVVDLLIDDQSILAH
jgi:uncharacterized membrane-anchored protein